MATPEENKETIRRLIKALNERDRDAFDACYADEIVVFSPHTDELRMNHDEHWEQVLGIFEVFPDYMETLLNMIAEDDHVFLYWTSTGTHLGRGKLDAEPTGVRVEWSAFADYTLVDGKVVAAWELFDRFSMYQQLGLITPPGS